MRNKKGNTEVKKKNKSGLEERGASKVNGRGTTMGRGVR